MASEEREILKYELDLTDFEAKAARAQQLVEQIKAKRTAGGDSSELEQQLGKELEAFQKLVPSQKEAKDATEQLIASKHKLASVVSLVGGQFGGEIGQVANLVSILGTAGTTVGGVAAGLAAMAILIQVFRSIAEEAKKATEQQWKFNDAVAASQRLKQATANSIAEALEHLGLEYRTPENVKSAEEMRARLRKGYGIEEGRATTAATLATAAGEDTDAAAVLNVLAGQGVSIDSPEKARLVLGQARATGQYDKLLAAAGRYRLDKAGVAAAQKALVPGQSGGAGVSPEQATYDAMKEQGALESMGLPADTTFAQFQAKGMAAEVAAKELPGLEEKLRDLRKSGRKGAPFLPVESALIEQINRTENVVAQWAAIKVLIRQLAEAEGGVPAPNTGPLVNPAEPVDAGDQGLRDFIAGLKKPTPPVSGTIPSDRFGQPAPGPGREPPAAPRPAVNQNVYYSFGTAFFAQGDPRGRDLRTKFGINSEVDIVSPL
jgi:hypothetical protein